MCYILQALVFLLPPTTKILEKIMLTNGDTAPAFSTFNQDNKQLSLADFAGKNVVLYFYPKDDTPGCTIEANDFTAMAGDFAALNTVVVGASRDNCQSHLDFINKFGLKLDLLSDEDGELCKSYDVWREKIRNGVKSMAILRSTFVIDQQGKIAESYYGVSHEGHAATVLERVRQLAYRD